MAAKEVSYMVTSLQSPEHEINHDFSIRAGKDSSTYCSLTPWPTFIVSH